jgi:hypothetical protein
LPFLAKYIIVVQPELANITFVEGKLENFDADCYGSNTARYFEYYFKDKPAIIRKAETLLRFKWKRN